MQRSKRRVSVAHMREQRKFNLWAGKPWGSRRSQHSEPIRLYRLVPGVHDVQQFLPLVDRSIDYHHHISPWGTSLRPSSTHYNPLASFFVTHGTSSPSSTSYRRSCSPREFTFRLLSSTTKATPRFALTHWIFLIPAIPLPDYRRYLPVLCFTRPGT
jgi:hypothetical protein